MICVELYKYVLKCSECANPAIYLTERPTPFSRTSSSIVYLLNGDKPRYGDPIACGSCGEYCKPKTDLIEPFDKLISDKKWVQDCLYWRGKVLKGDHRHWCPDWDFLPIDSTSIEYPCACYQNEAKNE